MPEKTPPAYKWAVSLLVDTSPGFVVEAAYPVLADDGFMLLKDSDHKIVFAAAPRTGCTFTRLAAITPQAHGADFVPPPPPVTFAEFAAAWDAACVRAWDDGHRHPVPLLPDFMWPGVAEMVNPVTGKLADVTRVHTFPVQNDQGEEDAKLINLGAVSAADIRRMPYRPDDHGEVRA